MSPLLMLLAAGSAFADGPELTPERVMAALELPAKAQSLRDAGVDAAQVKEALDAARGEGVAAADASALFAEADTAVAEHGNIDNFGAFVKGKLAEGLRGQELAAAIKAEHAANGKGKAKGADAEAGGQGKSQGKGEAKSDKGTERTRGESSTQRSRGEGSSTERTRGEASGRTRGETSGSRSRGETSGSRSRGTETTTTETKTETKSTEKSDTKRSR